jgi:hypothetical protein
MRIDSQSGANHYDAPHGEAATESLASLNWLAYSARLYFITKLWPELKQTITIAGTGPL